MRPPAASNAASPLAWLGGGSCIGAAAAIGIGSWADCRPGPRPAATQQVTKRKNRPSRAVRAGDMAGVLAAHAPDVRLFDVPPPTEQRGLDGYRRSWELFFGWAREAGRFELRDLEILAGADVAFSHALIDCAGTESDGRRTAFTVRLTTGWRKDGTEWRIVHEHHSVPAGDAAVD